MNESQKRILVGLVAGSALSLTLGVTAHAEATEVSEDPNTKMTNEQSVTDAGLPSTSVEGTGEGTGEGTVEGTVEGTGEGTGEGTDEGTGAVVNESD